MTVYKVAELQAALKARLEPALEGEGPEGEDIPVLTKVLDDAAQIHVRIDGWTVHQGAGGAGRFDKYTFMVHVFCEESADASDEIIDPEFEAMRIQNLVIDALDDWRPLSGEGLIEHIRTAEGAEEPSGVYHGVSRFEATVEGT